MFTPIKISRPLIFFVSMVVIQLISTNFINMKAVRIHEYGSDEQLRYEDTPVPEISEEQVLVKVYATSVNHLDMKKASGTAKDRMPIEFPWIPGHDFAGVVEKAGANISEFKIGDKVYGNCMGGSYAEYLAADINKIVKMPDNLSFIEASSVPHVAETAWQALYKHGKLEKGQTVLVHGGAGAVGAYAIQFAWVTGAKILATAGEKDIEFVKSLGADEVIDYRKQDFTVEFKDVDLVLSLVGGSTEEKSYSVLKNGGRLISTVGVSHQDLAKEKDVTAIGMVIEQSADDLKHITELIIEGKVKTDIGTTFPLEDAAKGWKALSGDSSIPHPSHGKIILEIHK